MKKGFTILELLLVVSMLSIFVLLFVSYTGDVGNVAVDAASWKIQSDIRHAQQLSILTGIPHGVQFMMGGTYIVYSGDVSTPIIDPSDKKPMVESMSQFGNVLLSKSYNVEFDKVGHPTTGGGGSVEVVADSGASRRIYMVEDTGAVVVDVLGYGSSCNCNVFRSLR